MGVKGQPEMAVAEDPFDSVVGADERWHDVGYAAGFKQGVLEGRLDGYATGQTKGLEMGDEIGYYLGFAEMLLELKLKGRERLEKHVLALSNEVKSFCCLDFSSPTYQDDLRRIKGRFRQISSILKFKGPQEKGQVEQSF